MKRNHQVSNLKIKQSQKARSQSVSKKKYKSLNSLRRLIKREIWVLVKYPYRKVYLEKMKTKSQFTK